jgi:hypothetical protein
VLPSTITTTDYHTAGERVRAAVTAPLFLDAAAIHAACPPEVAVAAVEAALRGGLDPTIEPPRSVFQVAHGQFLLMPSEAAETSAGVKVVTVAPGNPSRGLPRVQAVYLHFDRDTLALTAVIDGTALTALRTPAVSIAAVRQHLPDRPLRLVVIGAGPQATGHVITLAAVRSLASIVHLVRDPSRVRIDARLLPLGSSEADAGWGPLTSSSAQPRRAHHCSTRRGSDPTSSSSRWDRTSPTPASWTARCSPEARSSSRTRPPRSGRQVTSFSPSRMAA